MEWLTGRQATCAPAMAHQVVVGQRAEVVLHHVQAHSHRKHCLAAAAEVASRPRVQAGHKRSCWVAVQSQGAAECDVKAAALPDARDMCRVPVLSGSKCWAVVAVEDHLDVVQEA